MESPLMRSAHFKAIGILDAAVQLTLRVASPWVGVLWITALPLRLLQLYFVFQLHVLGEPRQYGQYLSRLAMLVFAAFIVSLYGRVVYVRACYFAGDSGRDSAFEALKVPLADFVPYVYTALINECFFYLTLITFLAWPVFIVIGGLAAATSCGIGGPKLLDAPLTALSAGRQFRSLLAITVVFAIGVLMAFINLYVLCELALMLFGPLLGPALPRWEHIFKAGSWPIFPEQPLTCRLLLIGGAMLVEPFWLAANVDLLQKTRARKSGEDLRLWFREIKAADDNSVAVKNGAAR